MNYEMESKNLAANYSPHLFWDVDKSKIDFDGHKSWVMERVLSHGLLTDWFALKAQYGRETIREEVLQIRYLDQYSLHFCAAYFEEPLMNFRCYKLAQLNPGHWVY